MTSPQRRKEDLFVFDEVERKPNFGNSSLSLVCDSAELVVLCKVIFWKTHIDFLEGRQNGHPASFLQGHVTA